MDYYNVDEHDVLKIIRQWQSEDYCNRAFLLAIKSDTEVYPFGEICAARAQYTSDIKDMLKHLFRNYPSAEVVAREIIREHDETENEAKKTTSNDTARKF